MTVFQKTFEIGGQAITAQIVRLNIRMGRDTHKCWAVLAQNCGTRQEVYDYIAEMFPDEIVLGNLSHMLDRGFHHDDWKRYDEEYPVDLCVENRDFFIPSPLLKIVNQQVFAAWGRAKHPDVYNAYREWYPPYLAEIDPSTRQWLYIYSM